MTVSGPAAVLRNVVHDGLLEFRNEESLRCLRESAEQRKEEKPAA